MGRLTGIPGVAIVTAGPGMSNTITALKNAQVAHSPVILISGASPLLTKNRGSLQDINQIEIVKSLCKATFTVKSIKSIVSIVKKAYFISQSNNLPGPVFIEFPIDVIYPILEVKTNMGLINKIKLKHIKDKINQISNKIIIPYEYQQDANKTKKEILQHYLQSKHNDDYIYKKRSS